MAKLYRDTSGDDPGMAKLLLSQVGGGGGAIPGMAKLYVPRGGMTCVMKCGLSVPYFHHANTKRAR